MSAISEPDLGKAVLKDESLNQPVALYLLCLTEAFERFGFYTMRAIIVLYMTKVLLFSNARSYELFAGFSALLYFAPLIGGYLGDKVFSIKKSVLFGGILLSSGYALLACSSINIFYFGMGFIVMGGGLFIPNISAAVGRLYNERDIRRESGFSLFYGAVNFGSLFPPLIITSVILTFGWGAAFILAGLMVFIGTMIFWCGYPTIENNKTTSRTRNFFSTNVVIFGFIVSTVIVTSLIKIPNFINILILLSGIAVFVYILNNSFQFSSIQKNKLQLCLFLTLFTIIFEALLQQSAMSLTLFVNDDVNRSVGHWQIPTMMFQVLNPLFIILLAPIFSKILIVLEIKNLKPSIPVKFAFGTLLMGLGFVFFPLVINHAPDARIAWEWIVLSYFLQSLGELFVSPVGLSMISEWSPPSMLSSMMGFWYFATAMGSALGGFFSKLTLDTSNTIMGSSYGHAFGMIGLISIVSACFIFIGTKRKAEFKIYS